MFRLCVSDFGAHYRNQMARILLIDDDADLSRFLKLTLEKRGYQVECLEAADRGPQFLASGRFDLVLLDNRMPRISGIEFLSVLAERGLSVPVILMTGHGTAETAIQATIRGAFDYMIKPLSHEELSRQLEPLIDEALEDGSAGGNRELSTL